ncbi:MAG: exosome complex RNA-binding protein Rrp4 [Thermoprotei archaeon]|nr:exosome complex RNA-binding protein Rrp4 [TACK group archaeon]
MKLSEGQTTQAREVVVPGEKVADQGFRPGEGVYRDADGLYSSLLGVVERDEARSIVRVRALRGQYIPHPEDIIIGKVIEVGLTDWEVDINSPYMAKLDARDAGVEVDPITVDLRRYFDVGDYLAAKVVAFDRVTPPSLTVMGKGLGKIRGGIIVSVIPSRVPRIIGKKGSMISMLDKMLKVHLVVGQNGYVVVQGSDPDEVAFAVSVIRKIEAEAYTYGLTDRIKEILTKRYENQNGKDTTGVASQRRRCKE